MKELANKLFESREVSHMFHLQSKKHSEHIVLEEYYEGILDLIDDLVEVYQGQYELIGDFRKITETPGELTTPLSYFESLVKYVKEQRYQQIPEEEAHLQAIVDEILILQYKTIYKLKYLTNDQ